MLSASALSFDSTPDPTRASVASMTGSPTRAKLSQVDRPTGIAARLCSVLPGCFFRCHATRASTAARSSESRPPRSTRSSPIGRTLSRYQARNAAISWSGSIRPFCKASNPNSMWRSAELAAMGRVSWRSAEGGRRSGPEVGGLWPGREQDRLDCRINVRRMQPRPASSYFSRARSAGSIRLRRGASFRADPALEDGDHARCGVDFD